MLNSRRYLPRRSRCSSDALQDIRWGVTSGGSKAYLIVEQRSELEVRRFRVRPGFLRPGLCHNVIQD
jgi:hypothetical protein